MTAEDPDDGANGSTHVRRHVPLWLLTMLTFSGTLATYLILPVLPTIAADLGTSAASVQMSVSVYIVGLAVGQLVYGPISDRFGRRPVLMGGLAIYSVAGIGAALVPNVDALIVARLFQALGGCAGMVMGRAIVRDTAPIREAARRIAVMNLMVSVGPGTAPLMGSLVAGVFGWRSLFYLLFGLGVVNLAFICWLLPETGPKHSATNARTLARHYRQLLRSPIFLGYSIGGAFSTTSSYAFIVAAPFIYVHQLHRPEYEVGIHLALMITGSWLGSMLAARLIFRMSIDRLMVGSNLASILGAVIFLAAVLSGQLTMVLATATMSLFAFGTGLTSPTSATQAISVNPEIIGSASGLFGFMQMSVAALCSILAGIGNDPALAAGVVLGCAGVVSQIAFWIAIRKRLAA